MVNNVEVDLVPDEILTARPSVTLDVPAGVRPESVTGAVRVEGVEGEGVEGQVRAGDRAGRYHWTPGTDLAPGHYRLVVDAFADPEDIRPSEPVEVPFDLIATTAEIPGNLRVGSYVRVRLGPDGSERLPTDSVPHGPYIDFVKATDRETGAPVALSFDQDGHQIDGERRLDDAERERAGRYRKLHPALDAAVRGAGAGETLLTDVWFAVDEAEPDPADRARYEEEVAEADRRTEQRRLQVHEQTTAAVASLDDDIEVVKVDDAAPVATVRAPAAAIRRLAAHAAVAGLYLHEREGIPDLSRSIALARSDVAHGQGVDGSNVRVAVWEDGPRNTANLVVAGRYRANPAWSGAADADHSQLVHAVIRNRVIGSKGHAPGSNVYSANSFDRAALDWAVKEQSCTVVNQSFHRPSERGSGSLSADDTYGDNLVLNPPYPLIVHAAGNGPSSEYVNHKGYNTITVGSHNDAGTGMASDSAFRNPTTQHADRELPEISANGTGVSATGLTNSGTSFASPAVAGVAALIQETDGTLRRWPEGCRAILLASARRTIEGRTWWQNVKRGVDSRSGAGAVDATSAHLLAKQRRAPDSSGHSAGWDVGALTDGDFGGDKMSRFGYKVRLSGLVFAGSTGGGPAGVPIRVALAWNVKHTFIPGLGHGPYTFIDHDLLVYDENGRLVGYSGSYDNSYEIADFVAETGKTYTIRIRRWSGAGQTWYGIAWGDSRIPG